VETANKGHRRIEAQSPPTNNLVLALIGQAKFHNAAQARRWFAVYISQAYAILTTPFPRL
jgi:hypothetical protein